MIDHILGRPSPTIRRSQIFLVLFFWLWRLYKGDGAPRPTRTASALGPSPSGRVGVGAQGKRRAWLWRLWVSLVGRRAVGWMGKVNDKLQHFTPYQLILGTLTFVYALRHLDDLLGLGFPEPLARLYSRSYYRATYVNTAFDAGFASAMAIRPKWVKDIASVLFSFYYLIWAAEGDEVLRRFRALCTVEMLRTTWEKTNNPYVRLMTTLHRPHLPIVKKVIIPRPSTSSRASLPPVKAMLFFDGTPEALSKCHELVVDYPGGGFIAMGPECHEERLRRWAKRTRKPVLGVDYGKAPEYPYPWAIEEGFDAYRTLMETKGKCIGIDSGKLDIVLTGDSAGGNICATIMLRILEHPTGIPRPISMILAYPALDFNFTSWMSPGNLRVLRTEQSETHIPGIVRGKDHMRHKSPLSVVDDVEVKRKRPSGSRRQKSWGEAISSKIPGLTPVEEKSAFGKSPATSPTTAGWTRSLPRTMSAKVAGWLAPPENADTGDAAGEDGGSDGSDSGSDGETIVSDSRREADKALRERVKTPREEHRLELPPVDSPNDTTRDLSPQEVVPARKKRAPIGTRLTMTSRVGYFQDRIISPSMMRAMAILYIGPRRNPDFETDYYISPILSPPHLLAHFPPVYLICGERDPFVDDTVIFAGKIREAKRARRAQAESGTRTGKFGEGLRMSSSTSSGLPDHILRETDEDWVQIRIIEGWGHGFMQMAALMREVDSVLQEMADWIDESFEKAAERDRDIEDVAAAHQAAKAAFRPDAPVMMSPVDHLPPPQATHVKPVRNYKETPSHHGNADLGAPVSAEGDDSDEGVIAFTPKNKRKPPSSKFIPVPRRPSKESLHIQRNSSAPRFDVDETGSSGEAVTIKTPPYNAKTLPLVDPSPKGSGAFAFFGSSRSNSNSTPRLPPPLPPTNGSYGSSSAQRRSSGGAASAPNKTTNSLVAAAVAGARAASPALAAAGLVPQSLGNVTEAELMRRRRAEAVFGMGETDSAMHSDEEDHEDEH
ncbi:Alpha/Beta hydrolase protein [Naematelia encephala]|uniref:Alpha/Beta hydrolase protein n=1 Tax=Naematelia encephala TaxID=71784 RepID=A0A1Y2BDV1_9TREE|nr:Alpha/Beta hydrolase protein [Naematelia encephala]